MKKNISNNLDNIKKIIHASSIEEFNEYTKKLYSSLSRNYTIQEKIDYMKALINLFSIEYKFNRDQNLLDNCSFLFLVLFKYNFYGKREYDYKNSEAIKLIFVLNNIDENKMRRLDYDDYQKSKFEQFRNMIKKISEAEVVTEIKRPEFSRRFHDIPRDEFSPDKIYQESEYIGLKKV
jgi:hypothetical protein